MPREIRRASPIKCNKEEEGSTYSVTYKITISMLLNHSVSLHCTAKHIRLLTTRKFSVTSNGRHSSDLQAQSHGM